VSVGLAQPTQPEASPPDWLDEALLAWALLEGYRQARQTWGDVLPMGSWGEAVLPARLRPVLELATARGQRRLAEPTAALVAGNLDPDQWAEEMRRRVAVADAVMLWLILAGAGLAWLLLWAALSPRVLAPTGPAPDPNPLNLPDAVRRSYARLLGRQLSYLSRFRVQVVVGEIPLDGRVINRAKLYARAAWNVGQNAVRDALAGSTGGLVRIQERRILGPNENHCIQCPGYAARGWQPLNTLPGIGLSSDCQMFCRCTFAFRKVTTGRRFP
jgi:hypothetical protein